MKVRVRERLLLDRQMQLCSFQRVFQALSSDEIAEMLRLISFTAEISYSGTYTNSEKVKVQTHFCFVLVYVLVRTVVFLSSTKILLHHWTSQSMQGHCWPVSLLTEWSVFLIINSLCCFIILIQNWRTILHVSYSK